MKAKFAAEPLFTGTKLHCILTDSFGIEGQTHTAIVASEISGIASAAVKPRLVTGCAVIQELKRQRLTIAGKEEVSTAFDRGVDSSILSVFLHRQWESRLRWKLMMHRVLVGLALGTAVLADDLLYA